MNVSLLRSGLVLALGLGLSVQALAAGDSELDPAPRALPDELEAACEEVPGANTGLRHLRCGEARLLVTQLRPVQGSVHDELLVSVLDLVPTPATRREADTGSADLRQTRVDQRRDSLERGEMSVGLRLTTRLSTGQSVVCVIGHWDRRRPDRREEAWCEHVVELLLPAPASEDPTSVEVDAPDFPDDDTSP